MDNSKSKEEGVSRIYKGFDGYAPMVAYNILRMICQHMIGGRTPRKKRDVRRRRLHSYRQPYNDGKPYNDPYPPTDYGAWQE